MLVIDLQQAFYPGQSRWRQIQDQEEGKQGGRILWTRLQSTTQWRYILTHLFTPRDIYSSRLTYWHVLGRLEETKEPRGTLMQKRGRTCTDSYPS